jgi:tight adherence protein B
MNPVLIAGLAFVTVTSVILGLWWVYASESALRARLARPGEMTVDSPEALLRAPAADRSFGLGQIFLSLPWLRSLERLVEQAGWEGRTGRVLGWIIAFAVVGGVLGTLRMGNLVWGVLCAAAGGIIPILYLRYLRGKRLAKFSEQFPEALDMMTRALRTGYAVGAAFQLVAEDMPEPLATEFRRVFEQMALGRPTTEALKEMHDRIGTEDVRFFYIAVGIQREVGGNLAEILEKLAVVVRERYKLLAFAEVLSAQQRMSAYCVGASPFVAALVLNFMRPGWFEPVWTWPYGVYVVIAGAVWMAIGFLILKRIANITI